MTVSAATGAQARKIVLLDLDGTLTASAPGIIASVMKAYESLGLTVPDDAELHRFIGPAIIESLRRNHVPDGMLQQGVAAYRSYYSEIPAFDDPNNPGHKVPGHFCSSVFEGIPRQLAALRADGFLLALATAKPEYQAQPVCEHFGIDRMIDALYGASRDLSRLNKDQVIRYAFAGLNYDPGRGDRALMVGDRWTDVDGAISCGIDCLGCRWGYAERNELEEHGAYRVIDRVEQLHDAVAEYFG
ncbi:HAD hydrolase-like protein [Bifidobacterium sp.]|uniref:HAD hydrolase-like protein n=1 Tax=Bifidobacterium sp. TaxID=41200 RepID=UPI003DA997F3